MLVIAAKQHQSTWFQVLHDATLIGVADSGYMNDELMLERIAHFEKHSQRSQRGTWRLLSLDGYGSHHTLEFIRYCDELRIIPFDLPSRSAHFLQPLDVVIFQPYKHYHAGAVDRAARLDCDDYNELEFSMTLSISEGRPCRLARSKQHSRRLVSGHFNRPP
jgi:hypothetical protein